MDNESNKNDFDHIAESIDNGLRALLGSTHEPPRIDNGGSVTITKAGLLTGLIRLQRTRDWVAGLAESHREIKGDDDG